MDGIYGVVEEVTETVSGDAFEEIVKDVVEDIVCRRCWRGC